MCSLGHASRKPPPANPQPTANGIAPHSPANECGQGDGGADDRAGIGTGDQPGEQRALEHQVGGVVVEQDARRDAERQRDGQTEREGEAIGPVAALEDQDVAEAPIARQHRRQRCHDGELADQRRQQELLGGEERGAFSIRPVSGRLQVQEVQEVQLSAARCYAVQRRYGGVAPLHPCTSCTRCTSCTLPRPAR